MDKLYVFAIHGKVEGDGLVRNILLVEGKVDQCFFALEITFKVHRCRDLPILVLPQDRTEHCITAQTEKIIYLYILEIVQVGIKDKHKDCLIVFTSSFDGTQTHS